MRRPRPPAKGGPRREFEDAGMSGLIIGALILLGRALRGPRHQAVEHHIHVHCHYGGGPSERVPARPEPPPLPVQKSAPVLTGTKVVPFHPEIGQA